MFSGTRRTPRQFPARELRSVRKHAGFLSARSTQPCSPPPFRRRATKSEAEAGEKAHQVAALWVASPRPTASLPLATGRSSPSASLLRGESSHPTRRSASGIPLIRANWIWRPGAWERISRRRCGQPACLSGYKPPDLWAILSARRAQRIRASPDHSARAEVCSAGRSKRICTRPGAPVSLKGRRSSTPAIRSSSDRLIANGNRRAPSALAAVSYRASARATGRRRRLGACAGSGSSAPRRAILASCA
jgi:hypothetical protein